jgi:Txe/YoeB family toxin of Txe-Axe toxin-antitoxin module
MPSYIGAAIATVKHTCWEFYRLIGDKTKASLRRVLRRVLRLNLTTFTVNGGIYEPLAARIGGYYSNTTVQNRWFVTRLWLSEVTWYTQRAFFEATAGECDELDTTSCQMA